MMIFKSKYSTVLEKELLLVEKREQKLRRFAMKHKSFTLKSKLEEKIPQKVYSGLVSAFCKGFSVVFEKGKNIIEKSYSKENILADYAIRDYAVIRKGGRREYRQMHKSAGKSGTLNLTITTLEGLALGALGIGMPDIVLFLAALLKGIYETALNYGFEYDSKQEQYIILKMIEASLTYGDERVQLDREVDELFDKTNSEIEDERFNKQLNCSASAFAMDMLLIKFIQGFPIIGIIGGAANPVYYNKIMKYVSLKYRKRYLLGLTEKI